MEAFSTDVFRGEINIPKLNTTTLFGFPLFLLLMFLFHAAVWAEHITEFVKRQQL